MAHPYRYAILHHVDIARPHFDLLFETRKGSKLKAWRSPIWPISKRTRLTPLPDHRQLYLDYEGPLTDNRGCVIQIQSGGYILKRNGGGTKSSLQMQLDTGQMLELKLTGKIWTATLIR